MKSPPTLRHDLQGASNDAAGARAWMAGICGPHALEVRGPGRLRFRHRGNRLLPGGTSLGIVEYGVDVDIGITHETPLRCFSVSLPLRGEQELNVGTRHHSHPACGLVLDPSAPQALAIAAACRKIIVAIDRVTLSASLEELLQRRLGNPLRFQPISDLRAGATASWWNLVRHLCAELENPAGLCRDPRIARELEQTLLKGLLLSQPHNYSETLQTARRAAVPAHVQRLHQFLLDNARETLRGEDLPRIAGYSRSKVQADFKAHFGVAPFVFLRHHRLRQAREALLAAEGRRPVSEVALDWGFDHLGRFARDYQAAFGELPSATGQWARRRPGHCPRSGSA